MPWTSSYIVHTRHPAEGRISDVKHWAGSLWVHDLGVRPVPAAGQPQTLLRQRP